jgi:hypothetical protein
MRGLELIRTDATQVAVATNRVVEVINVLGYVKDGGFATGIDTLLDALFLETSEEGLCHGIVQTVSSSAHAWF